MRRHQTTKEMIDEMMRQDEEWKEFERHMLEDNRPSVIVVAVVIGMLGWMLLGSIALAFWLLM